MTALGRHQREAFLQVKTHLMAENGDRASAGAVIFACPRRALSASNQDTVSWFLKNFVAADDDGTPKPS
jgi:hypothetical protein